MHALSALRRRQGMKGEGLLQSVLVKPWEGCDTETSRNPVTGELAEKSLDRAVMDVYSVIARKGG